MNVHRVQLITVHVSCSCRYRTGALVPYGMRQPLVQIACPEHTPPLAGLALAGDTISFIAASPGHRIPELIGRRKMQGKIKGRGTLAREKAVCTWGGRGTRLRFVACREKRQCRVRTDIAACYLRPLLLDFAGDSP